MQHSSHNQHAQEDSSELSPVNPDTDKHRVDSLLQDKWQAMNEWFPILVIVGTIQLTIVELSKVSGGWGGWGEWTPCSRTCGYGSIQRSRQWIYGDGKVTNYTYTLVSECWTKKPCPIHGKWSMWTAWSPCPVMCDGGNIERKRLCNNPTPGKGGDFCEGNSTETEPCNLDPCPVLPSDFDMSLCNQSMFMCASQLQCVPTANRCDFTLHCHDGTDEKGCDALAMEINSQGSTSTHCWMTLLVCLLLPVCVR